MRALVIAVWIVMVMATGYALFHITFQVEALEGQLAELNRQIRKEQEHIHNLKAEWSFNSRPDWVEALGEEYLPDMQRMHPSQALRIEDIPFRRLDEETIQDDTDAAAAAIPGPAEAVSPSLMMRTSQ